MQVLHKNFILTKISSLHFLYGLLILFKMHFELILSDTEMLFFIRLCQIFLMSWHKRIHKQRSCKIDRPMESLLSLNIDKCPLSVLKRCPFYRELQHSKSY